jgi:hypothetical protein
VVSFEVFPEIFHLVQAHNTHSAPLWNLLILF